MNKTLIILTSELKGTLKRKGFMITTLALPVLGLLIMLIFNVVTNNIQPSSEAENIRIGYVDQAGIFSQYTQQGDIQLVPYTSAEQATAGLLANEIREYFVIPKDYIASGLVFRYSLNTSLEPPANFTRATKDFLISNLVHDKVSPDIMARLQAPLAVSSIVLDRSGQIDEGQNGWGAWVISYLFGLLLVMSIFTVSGYLLQGLSEEKENRVMEILLSSVSTRQLITGKVLGLGAAGLIQMIFWLFSAWGLLSLASSSIGGIFSSMQFPVSVIALSLVYFILGYFLFAILLAGIGAIVPTVRDGQQLSVMVTLLGSIPFFMMTFIIENGDHLLNIILTLFPLTAPLTVMMRINAGIPVWELATSVILMILSITGSLYIVSRLFRTYLLMYGKTPGLKALVRSLRQS